MKKKLPKKWYNINSDLPVPLPEPKNPEEKDNISKLPQMFSSGVLEQEMSMERWIKNPKRN
jgi:Predicted alternative tryptophan synthase beta-subunit (paralog of TrpB)